MNPNLPAAAALACLVLSACAPTTPTFDRHFGETVTTLRAQQVRNPDAPLANRDKSVDGLDGPAVREAMDRYYESFAEPPVPVNPFLIGVGTGASNGR